MPHRQAVTGTAVSGGRNLPTAGNCKTESAKQARYKTAVQDVYCSI